MRVLSHNKAKALLDEKSYILWNEINLKDDKLQTFQGINAKIEMRQTCGLSRNVRSIRRSRLS